MATLTKFVSGQNNPRIGSSQAAQGISSVVQACWATIDFSQTGGSAASADVVQVLNIPAGAFVHNVYVVVLTAEGATLTVTVGDDAGTSSWDASVDLNAAANTETAGLPGTDAYATAGKYYPTADTIDFTMNNAASTAKVKVVALYSMVGV